MGLLHVITIMDPSPILSVFPKGKMCVRKLHRLSMAGASGISIDLPFSDEKRTLIIATSLRTLFIGGDAVRN